MQNINNKATTDYCVLKCTFNSDLHFDKQYIFNIHNNLHDIHIFFVVIAELYIVSIVRHPFSCFMLHIFFSIHLFSTQKVLPLFNSFASLKIAKILCQKHSLYIEEAFKSYLKYVKTIIL